MPTTIYKYLKAEHLNAFFLTGKIRIGTLFDYRREEDLGSVIGDKEEGLSKVIFENKSDTPFEVNFDEDSPEARHFEHYLRIKGMPGSKAIINPGVRFDTTIHSPNCYIYCTSSKFDPDVMAEYGGSCIEIFNAENLFYEISQVMKRKRKVLFRGFHPIVYCDRESDYKNPHETSAALMKNIERKRDHEIRAIWHPEDVEINETHVDIIVRNAVKWCRIHTKS